MKFQCNNSRKAKKKKKKKGTDKSLIIGKVDKQIKVTFTLIDHFVTIIKISLRAKMAEIRRKRYR